MKKRISVAHKGGITSLIQEDKKLWSCALNDESGEIKLWDVNTAELITTVYSFSPHATNNTNSSPNSSQLPKSRGFFRTNSFTSLTEQSSSSTSTIKEQNKPIMNDTPPTNQASLFHSAQLPMPSIISVSRTNTSPNSATSNNTTNQSSPNTNKPPPGNHQAFDPAAAAAIAKKNFQKSKHASPTPSEREPRTAGLKSLVHELEKNNSGSPSSQLPTSTSSTSISLHLDTKLSLTPLKSARKLTSSEIKATILTTPRGTPVISENHQTTDHFASSPVTSNHSPTSNYENQILYFPSPSKSKSNPLKIVKYRSKSSETNPALDTLNHSSHSVSCLLLVILPSGSKQIWSSSKFDKLIFCWDIEVSLFFSFFLFSFFLFFFFPPPLPLPPLSFFFAFPFLPPPSIFPSPLLLFSFPFYLLLSLPPLSPFYLSALSLIPSLPLIYSPSNYHCLFTHSHHTIINWH